MKILDASATLSSEIANVRDRRVRIVTAYATDVLETLQSLVNRNCRIQLIVGTIDCFNHPEHLAQIGKLAGVELWVDFRRQNSVHWKLYLLEPFDVIIGSPNFTGRGLATDRDIAGVVQDAEFYSGLDERIDALLRIPGVTKFGSAAFVREMVQYTVDFENAQQRRRASGVSGAAGSVEVWLSDEGNQELKLYVWEETHTEVSKRRARRMATKGRQSAGMPTSPRSPLREFFTMESRRPPFMAGDVVLCCRASGAYMDFYRFDLIERGEDNLLYMIDMRSSKPPRLFDVGKAKDRLAAHIKQQELAGAVTLSRSTLLELFS